MSGEGEAGFVVERLADGLAPFAARCEPSPSAGGSPPRGGSRGRRHEEEEHAYRSAYQRDRDRIVHSTAFRRLEYKTQVFVNHEGDHYRTRLTHTMEVAQVARTIARALGLNEDLTEAVALAHDIGHTPFGHSGEEALNEITKEQGGFEHNRHGLRVVDELEKRYARFTGLNLTYEVREAFVRHRTAYDSPAAPSPESPPGEFPPGEETHLEGQVVCAADAVAYDSHDLDDGLASGLLAEEDLDALALWRRAKEAALADLSKAGVAGGLDAKTRRREVVRRLINLQVTDILEASSLALREAGVRSLDDVRACGRRLVGPGEAVASEKRELQAFLLDRLYRHHRVMRTANKARTFVRALFDEFMAHPEDLPDDYRTRIDRDGIARVACDYIAGMTDRYAQDAYRKLFYPFERM